MITDDQLTEWREEVDGRIVDLAERLVAAGPKAAHVSASELHEVAAFISDVALVALPALIAEVLQARALRADIALILKEHPPFFDQESAATVEHRYDDLRGDLQRLLARGVEQAP
jgi:hypothetical protein